MIELDDLGLSREAFEDKQKKLKIRTEKYALAETGKERAKEAKLYFEFDTTGMRDEAMKLLNGLRAEKHEFEESFRYFSGCTIDPKRPDVGLQISFSKNPVGLGKTFKIILDEQGIPPREKYQTADGEPAPEETEIFTQ